MYIFFSRIDDILYLFLINDFNKLYRSGNNVSIVSLLCRPFAPLLSETFYFFAQLWVNSLAMSQKMAWVISMRPIYLITGSLITLAVRIQCLRTTLLYLPIALVHLVSWWTFSITSVVKCPPKRTCHYLCLVMYIIL